MSEQNLKKKDNFDLHYELSFGFEAGFLLSMTRASSGCIININIVICMSS